MGPPEAAAKQIDWVSLQLPDGKPTTTPIRVSNPELSVPKGWNVLSDFVTDQDCCDILLEFDRGSPIWEGFEQRRRVLRWACEDPERPSCLEALQSRVQEATGYTPQHVSIEEYPKTQLQNHFSNSQSVVTTFESPSLCLHGNANCDFCFVATLPIAASVIEHLNRPKRRSADCWDLYSCNKHSTGVMLDRRSLFVKTKECLWEWRSRISSAVKPSLENDDSIHEYLRSRFVLVKFSSLPQPTQASADSAFGHIASPQDRIHSTEEMPPLEQLLTVIVTTSPIKSNPSTELLERVFDTFCHGGEGFALRCRKVIVCDGCREKKENVSKRHANIKQAMRNGIVDSEQLVNYQNFKVALKKLCETAKPESPFHNAQVEELEERQGYGFALRHALKNCVKTPYVIVIQHDRTFMRTCPILETVHTMWRNRNVKYVGMSMRSNLMYRDIFLCKYGRSFMGEMASCTLRPPELALDANIYGPTGESAANIDCGGREDLRENLEDLKETYIASQQNLDHMEWIKSNSMEPGKWQLSLTPAFFWYDNVHICETQHYRDFVFNPKYKMVVKGGFVEDKLSPVIKKTVERFGLTQGHSRFGCFLLDDHSGYFFTGHMDGGSYLTKAEKEAITASAKK